MSNLKISSYIAKENNSMKGLMHKVSLIAKWNDILSLCLENDQNIMRHCHAIKIEKNSLIVVAESPHWVSKLKYKIPELLPKVKAHKELENIKAITCKSLPYTAHKKIKKTPSREPLKISSKTADDISEIAETIKDKKLKAILKKIASY